MTEMLASLWNGNLAPVYGLGKDNEELKHLEELIERNSKKLEESLNEAQKARWETFSVGMEEYLSLIAEQAFCDGFCLGAKIMTEALFGAKRLE